MSSSSRSLRSTSKQRGAEMSSRLIPPKTGAIAFTVATISSTSFVARQIGKASTPPNSLNSIALPSITGSAASGPMSPSPSTAVPSLTTATVCCLIVRFQTFDGSSAIADETRATPGVYAIDRSSRVFSGVLQRHLDLAAEVEEERAVGDVDHLDAGHLVDGRGDRVHVLRVVGEHGDVADLRAALDPHEVDRAEQAARVADRLGEPGKRAGLVLQADAKRRAERG